MEDSVLLGTKPLVDSIRHFIRDPSGVFSVCHLCECRIVQRRHDSRLFLCWLASRLLFRAEEWRAGLFALAMKTWKERELKEENLVRFKSFQRMPSRLWRKREIEDSTPVELQGIIEKFVLAVRKKMAKNTRALVPRKEFKISKTSTGIFT